MLRTSSVNVLAQYEPTPYQAIDDNEDEYIAAEQEEQVALMRLDTEYFRVVENNSERLVLRNRPFWFSTCLGIFFLIVSAPFVIPFFLIVWSATWEVIIFDRRRDSVCFRRRYVCGSFKTVQRLKLSNFEGFIINTGYVSSRLEATFKTGERIPLTNGLSEVGDERETVLRIARKWINELSPRGLSLSRSSSPSMIKAPSTPNLNLAQVTTVDSDFTHMVVSPRNGSKHPKQKAPSSDLIDIEMQKKESIVAHNLLVGDAVYALCSALDDAQFHEAVVEEIVYAKQSDGEPANDRFRLYFSHLNKREIVELNAINLESKRAAPNSCPKF